MNHREEVGGLWDEIGELQLGFMVANGLERHHKLLDIGCGSGRGGVLFADYLEPGNYYGIDKNEALLDAARFEIGEYNQPTLLHDEHFNFDRFDTRFDFALAHSVFTHLSLGEISRCLAKLHPVMRSDGVFYATYFHPEGDQPFNTSYRKDPYHCGPGVLAAAARHEGWTTVNDIGSWGHPRGQMMMEFHP